MEYNNATIEGPWKFLIIELLKRTIKNQKTNIIYEHNSMFTVKKQSIWHPIKPKQNSLTCTSLEKTWDRFSVRPFNRSKKGEKKSKRCKVKKNTFLFLKTINFTVINVIDITWYHWNFHLYLHRKQLRHAIIQFSIEQNFKANGTHDYCYKPKREQKSSKMYKSIKISSILWSLVVKEVTNPRNKSWKLKPL